MNSNIYYKRVKQPKNNLQWEIYIKGDSLKIGTVQFYTDTIGIWINKMDLTEMYRGQGIIAQFIHEKKLEYGKILVSIADKNTHKKFHILDDTRYVEEPDGTRCVANLYKYKILDETHFVNPFPDCEIVFGKRKFPFLNWD